MDEKVLQYGTFKIVLNDKTPEQALAIEYGSKTPQSVSLLKMTTSNALVNVLFLKSLL